MRENEIASKCMVALLGVALVVCAAVLGSWWMSAPKPVQMSPKSASPARAAAAVPATVRAETPAGAQILLAAAAAAVPAAAGTEPLERRAFQLEMENARLRGRLDDMLNWILDNVRGTFPMPENQMANLRVVPVDDDMAVSDDLVQLLRLGDEEVDRLDAAFMGTRAVLQDLEAENIAVDEPAENQVVLNIPPYAEEGGLVREELYGELKKTLGAARFDRFRQVAEAGLDEKFEYFGEVDRTLQFEAMEDEVSGVAQLFVRDERVLPSKDDPLRQDITASERIVTELPAEYYPYWNFLPEYVTRFSRSN